MVVIKESTADDYFIIEADIGRKKGIYPEYEEKNGFFSLGPLYFIREICHSV